MALEQARIVDDAVACIVRRLLADDRFDHVPPIRRGDVGGEPVRSMLIVRSISAVELGVRIALGTVVIGVAVIRIVIGRCWVRI